MKRNGSFKNGNTEHLNPHYINNSQEEIENSRNYEEILVI